MSNTGIRGYYLVTNTLKDQLLKDANINEVTSGDISQVNLRKQSIFPLAHKFGNEKLIFVCVSLVKVKSQQTHVSSFEFLTSVRNIYIFCTSWKIPRLKSHMSSVFHNIKTSIKISLLIYYYSSFPVLM